MSAEYSGPTGALLGDDDPEVDSLINATLEETPLESAQQQSDDQPAEIATGDTDGVVKDPKSWDRLSEFVAEFTGKDTAEVKAMPFTERMEILKTTQQELTTKLEKLSEFEDFVGIKVDAPADQWNPMEQISALPTNHQNKLIDAVYKETLPFFTQSVLNAPDKYPDEFGLLKSSAATIASAAYGRPVDELDAIMSELKGVTLAEIRQVKQQQGVQGQPYQGQPYTAAPYAPTAPLYEYARQVGMDLTDPSSPEAQFVAAASNIFARMQSDTQSQLAQMQAQFGKVSQRTSQFEQQQKETAVQRAQSEIDQQAEAARNGVLDQITQGKLPEGRETRLKQLILNDATAAINADQRAQTALKLAKDYKVDGVEGKANGQLGIYLNRVNHHILEAAKTVLSEVTVPGTAARRQVDQQKAAQRHLGAPAGGDLTPASLQAIANRRVRTPQDAVDAVTELYRGQQGP